MATMINYFVEANLALLLFLIVYRLLLSKETDFKFIRFFLIGSIFISLVFPLIHLSTISSGIPSVGELVPSFWLPEVATTSANSSSAVSTSAALNFWDYTAVIYCAGVFIFLMIFTVQIFQLTKKIRKSSFYTKEGFHIIETAESPSTFSFFNFIFIGNSDGLTEIEKQQIIIHESVHARQWHSFDILLINILRIAFWFNPFIIIYKKIFVQLHEFEADARAVKNDDADNYCSLLARVALQSAGFSIANHFNNSLTLKRIQMLRTLKSKIKVWKLAALTAIIPLVFFIIACQDQVMDDIKEIAGSSAVVLDVPAEVQKKLDEFKKANPDKKYLLIEPTGNGQHKLDLLDLESYKIDPSWVSYIHVMKDIVSEKGGEKRSFVIIEWNEKTAQLPDITKKEDVYTVVENQPEYPGGYEALREFIQANLTYPAEARQKGAEGTVFVSFIVEKNGTISDVKTVRGIGPEFDEEAMRVVRMFPNWNPGKQDGEPVKVRFVLPVKFKL